MQTLVCVSYCVLWFTTMLYRTVLYCTTACTGTSNSTPATRYRNANWIDGLDVIDAGALQLSELCGLLNRKMNTRCVTPASDTCW